MNLDPVSFRSREHQACLKSEWKTATRPIRVMLIQPPNIGGVRSLLSHMSKHGESIGFKPPLGLLYIATLLKEKTPHQVRVLDAQAQGFNLEECIQEVEVHRPDVVGISAWTDWWYPAFHLGRLIKNLMPEVHICYGGPHVNIYLEETLSAEHVDSIIVGDGEIPFTYLCNMFANYKIDNDLPGLHFKKYGVKNGEQRFFIQKNLDDLPIPDRSLLPLSCYTSVIGKSNFVTTMLTSRGCPHKCIFCKMNYQKMLCRSAENVIKEFERIHDLGIKEVEIYDDTFTWSKKRTKDICQGLITRKIKLTWSIRDRVNSTDPELLDLMKRSGCLRIHYGIESGVNRILGLMEKNITTDQASGAVRLAKKKGFSVLTYFMIGNKGETVKDIKRSIDFALDLDADYTEFSITIPYPGTEMYTEALSKGIISYDYWREFALRPTANFCIPEVYEENLHLGELISFRNEAVRRYYFRPGYIIREILKIKQWSEFRRKAKMGLRLMSSIFKNPISDSRSSKKKRRKHARNIRIK